MSKKQKLVPCIITSRESMESVVADIVRLKLAHVQATAAMEAEIAEVQKKHQDGILGIARQLEIKEAGVFIFCEQNRKELFTTKKSIETVLAVIGYRFGNPSVEKRAKSDTWGMIAARLNALDWGTAYVIEPDVELNKKQLLNDRTKLTNEQLAQAGIKIEQDENFYIEPKSEVAEATIQAAA